MELDDVIFAGGLRLSNAERPRMLLYARPFGQISVPSSQMGMTCALSHACLYFVVVHCSVMHFDTKYQEVTILRADAGCLL